MQTSRLFLAVTVLPLIFLVACGQAPDPERQAAERAVEQARQAEAAVYAADEFRQAEEALEAGLKEVEAESGRFAFLRDFSEAERHFERAASLAHRATERAEAGKEQARMEARRLEEEAAQALEEAEEALQRAPRPAKGARADLAVLTEDLESARSMYQEALRALEEDRFRQAVDHFEQAQRRALDARSHMP